MADAVQRLSFSGAFSTVLACFLCAGCTPTPLELKERELLVAYDQFKRDSKDRDLEKDALEYWQRKAASASADRRRAEAEREYNGLALRGQAGTGEQLIAAKKVLDDPNYTSRLSTSGPQQSEVDHAWSQVRKFEQAHDNEARKVHDRLLPPLVKAASEYKVAYDTAIASGERPHQSKEVRDTLKDVREQVVQDELWVFSVKLRQDAHDRQSKSSKNR